MLNIKNSKVDGVQLINSKMNLDNRGNFFELYNKKDFNQFDINDNFIQDNISYSPKNVLRGLHYQVVEPQSQLLTLITGIIFDVIIDLRKNSNTFLKWESFVLNSEINNQVYMPPGIAHGYLVLSESAIIHYKVNKFYNRLNEGGIIWNDKFLDINWPNKKPIISLKDSKFETLESITNNNRFPKIL